jgi:2'-5' RNA ligase
MTAGLHSTPGALSSRYDAMWTEAAPVVRAGGGTRDPWLSRREEDLRRGVTLLARPSRSVAAVLAALLERLRALEPSQFYQPAADLHFTVLSLFTATADHAQYMEHIDAYRAAVAQAVCGLPPFIIDVRGVTLTPGAVLAQGFPRGDTLAVARERLRDALSARGLGGALDRRYRLETAHMTLARFVMPLRDAGRFVDALAGERDTQFGASEVRELELVFGDWYHSFANELEIERYALDRRPE